MCLISSRTVDSGPDEGNHVWPARIWSLKMHYHCLAIYHLDGFSVDEIVHFGLSVLVAVSVRSAGPCIIVLLAIILATAKNLKHRPRWTVHSISDLVKLATHKGAVSAAVSEPEFLDVRDGEELVSP